MKSSTTVLVFALVAAFSLAAADTDQIPVLYQNSALL